MRRVWGLRRDSRAVPKYMWPRVWSKLKFSEYELGWLQDEKNIGKDMIFPGRNGTN